MNFKKQLKDGLIYQNPVLVQVLGMCSTMAITTSISNGVGMGISVLIILTLSNIFISLLRKIIPNEVRIACYIVVIAGFVTIVDLCLQAFFPDIAKSLGVFIPLIVVNCIVLGRAEALASKNSVAASVLHAGPDARAARRRLPVPRHAHRRDAVGARQGREEDRGKERKGGQLNEYHVLACHFPRRDPDQ